MEGVTLRRQANSGNPAHLPEKKRQHAAFLSARIFLVVMFIGLCAVLTPLGYPMPAGFVIVLTVELAVLLAFRTTLPSVRTTQRLDRSHTVLLALEVIFHSAIFYFLGGLSWLGSIAYLYALMYGVIFLTWRQAATFTAVVCAGFFAVVYMDAAGVLPHQEFLPQGRDRYKDIDFLVPTILSFVGVMGTVTFWMVFIGGELRRERDVAIRAYDELAHAQAELQQLNEELENKVAERTKVLRFRAEHDTLTGLLNRGSIHRRCQEALVLAERSGNEVAVIVADGDDFKSCNDRVGHGYGDDILRTIAETLQETSRESDFVGRLGGDEFMIVLQLTNEAGAVRFCRRVLSLLESRKAEAAKTAGDLPFPMLSMGVAMFPEHGRDVDTLVKAADVAMYAAKAAGGARWDTAARTPVTDPSAPETKRVPATLRKTG